MTTRLSVSAVQQANDLLRSRENLIREFNDMTAGGKLPALVAIKLTSRRDGDHPHPTNSWELPSLLSTCRLDKAALERRVVVVILTLLSEDIDTIDRALIDLGVEPPARKPFDLNAAAPKKKGAS